MRHGSGSADAHVNAAMPNRAIAAHTRIILNGAALCSLTVFLLLFLDSQMGTFQVLRVLPGVVRFHRESATTLNPELLAVVANVESVVHLFNDASLNIR